MPFNKVLLLIGYLALSLVSCAKQSGVCYFPRKVGMHWEYLCIIAQPSSNNETFERKTYTIQEFIKTKNKIYNRFVICVDGTKMRDTIVFLDRIDDKGVYIILEDGSMGETEVQTFTFPFRVGVSGSYVTSSDNKFVKWSVDSIGTVEVNRIKYYDCLHISTVVLNTMIDTHAQSTSVLAPGVGKVKSIYTKRNGLKVTESLIRFNR